MSRLLNANDLNLSTNYPYGQVYKDCPQRPYDKLGKDDHTNNY